LIKNEPGLKRYRKFKAMELKPIAVRVSDDIDVCNANLSIAQGFSPG
jgi:hypothetical protein